VIKKPTAEWQREGEGARKAQAAVSDGMKSLGKSALVVQHGARTVQGYVGIAFGGFWILAGLAAGLGGSIPTLIGASFMGACAFWIGKRRIRKGKSAVRETLGLPEFASRTIATIAAEPGSVAPISIAGADMRDPLAGTFDADAIIARHLAEKARLEAQSQAAPVPLAQPGLPARPAFGRKVA
jgi:Flp pilus assembly protein TadB